MFLLYTNPAAYPSMERAARLLHENGCKVRVLGTTGLGTDAMGAMRVPDIDVRLISRAGSGVTQKLRYAMFVLWSVAHIFVWRPSWLYSSDSLTAPVALLAKLSGIRVVYHEHDTPVHATASVYLRVAARSRAAIMRRADLVITPSEGRSAYVSRESGRYVFTVWNCPNRSELRRRTSLRRRDQPLRLVYQGSLVPGRLPLTVVDALARTSEPIELWITGYETIGSANHAAEILRRAASVGIAERVHVLPVMPREAMLDRTAENDLGLALMPTTAADINESTMAGASNKAFEYLACGVPLLVTDLDDWRRMFVNEGVALSCDPGKVASIQSALDYAISHRDELERMGTLGRMRVDNEWNYETQFAPVMRAMLRSVRGTEGKSNVRQERAS
jgi:glycosyltransferase involved in cell wall biosynthesis